MVSDERRIIVRTIVAGACRGVNIRRQCGERAHIIQIIVVIGSTLDIDHSYKLSLFVMAMLFRLATGSS